MRLLVVLLFLSQLLFAREPHTVVKNQAEFDAAVEQINSGKEMHLVLRKGQYFLKGDVTAKAPLSICGRKATITTYDNRFECESAIMEDGDFWVYEINESVNPYSLFFDGKGTIVNVSESVDENESVNFCSGKILSDDGLKAGAVIKLPIPENLRHLINKNFDQAFGYFDCGWQVVKFLLMKSDDDYFYCKTLNNCRTGNYSYDKDVYKKSVRFVIYNAEKKVGSIYYDGKYLYIPKEFRQLYQLNCSDYHISTPNIKINSDFSMNGVRFCGMKGIEIKSGPSSVCEIKNCSFQNSLGTPLKVEKKKGKEIIQASIKDCIFKDCSLLNGDIITLSAPSDERNYINVSSCNITRYSNCRVSYKNPEGAIWVSGNVALLDNVVYNTPRCHIYLNRGKIRVAGNVIYNSDEFNLGVNRNLSNDWGLVYCNHVFDKTEDAINNKTHSILIENNLLYGAYAYGGDARGVFVDNGRGDVVCKNNIILNTQSYSIDSRNVNMHNASSVRNRYEHNIVTSRYRLAAGEAVKGNDVPITKANLVLTDRENVTSNAIVLEEEIRKDGDFDYSCEVDKIRVSRELYKEIRKSPAWKYMKRFVRKTDRVQEVDVVKAP